MWRDNSLDANPSPRRSRYARNAAARALSTLNGHALPKDPVTQPSTTAVIVTYNSRKTIDEALTRARECCDAGRMTCVVVDNRSSDGTLPYVRTHHPFVDAIDAGDNLGFGRGCNLGAERSSTRYTLFLNPDATLGLEALDRLVSFMDSHPEVGIGAPAIEGQEVGLMARPWDVLLESAGLKGFPSRSSPLPPTAPYRTNWVCGAAMLVRTAVFRDVGGFDPRFFLYFEETDLCRRIEAAGAQIWLVGDAVATHRDGASAHATGKPMFSGCIAEHYFRSRNYYFRKHYGPLTAALTELGEVLLLGGRAAVARALGRSDPLELLKQRLSGGVLRFPR